MTSTIGELLTEILEGEEGEGMIAGSVRRLLPAELQGNSTDVAALVAHALHPKPSDPEAVRAVLTGWGTRVQDACALPEEHPARRLTEELQSLQKTLKSE